MVLTALALLPGILIIIYIFTKDKVEREPVGLLIKLVLLGAFSCAPAAFLETYADIGAEAFPQGSWGYAITISFLSAGLMEELCKYLLLRFGSWKNKAFNYRFDGIVYGVCVACGFAMLENVMYVFQGGISVAITRAFLSVPLHAFCGAFMGAFYGMAKYKAVTGHRIDAFKCKACALIVPITIHGIYDTLCFVNWEPSSFALIGYAVILYIIGLKMINAIEKDDIGMCFYGPGEEGYTYVPSFENAEELEPVHQDRMKSTNGLSKLSLAFGVLSFVLMAAFILPSAAAIILGVIGKSKTGKGVKNSAATAGIVMGAISLALNVFLLTGSYI